MSISFRLREEGNEAFLAAEASPTLNQKRVDYETAIRAYITSVSYASSDDEGASARKNLMIASLKLSELDWADVATLQRSLKPLNLAIRSLMEALSVGPKVKTERWKDGLIEMMDGAMPRFLGACLELPIEERLEYFRALSLLFRNSNPFSISIEPAATLNFTLAELLLKLAILEESKEKPDFPKALSWLEEIPSFLARSESFSRNFRKPRDLRDDSFLGGFITDLLSKSPFFSKIDVLTMEVAQLKSQSSARQALVTGKELLARATQDSDELDLDLIWTAFDLFVLASGTEKDVEKNVEVEAEAQGKLATIYARFLHDQKKANGHGMQCMSLCLSLLKNVENLDFYVESKRIVGEYRQANEQEEDAERELLKAQIKDDLKKLDGAESMSHKVFIDFVYQNFPPTKKVDPKPKEGDSKKEKEKAMIRAANRSYISDDEESLQKKLLFEEIRMRLNNRLAISKSD